MGTEKNREADTSSNGLQIAPEQMLDLARKAELLGPRPATEPLSAGVEDLDVGADLWDGRVPAGRVKGFTNAGPSDAPSPRAL